MRNSRLTTIRTQSQYLGTGSLLLPLAAARYVQGAPGTIACLRAELGSHWWMKNQNPQLISVYHMSSLEVDQFYQCTCWDYGDRFLVLHTRSSSQNPSSPPYFSVMLMLVWVLQAVDSHPPHNRIKMQDVYYGNTFKKWVGGSSSLSEGILGWRIIEYHGV